MKEVILSETLTAMTIQKTKPLLNFSNSEGIIVGGFFVALAGAATLSPALATGSHIPVFALGVGTYLVSTLIGRNLSMELEIFTGERHTKKNLKEAIPSGERLQIGKTKYSDDKSLNPMELEDSNTFESYEVKTFVRNDAGKLSIEHEIKETALATWKKAFQMIMTNENIVEKDLYAMPFSSSFMSDDKVKDQIA